MKQNAVSALLFLVSYTVSADPYLYGNVCPAGPDGQPGGKVHGGYWVPQNSNGTGKFWADKWNFAQCNCTSYAAQRVNMNGITFNNSSFGQHWGDAGNWSAAARAEGIPVDALPAAGSIAQWEVNEISGRHGHVAYVERAFYNADESVRWIVISQYNITLNDYSWEVLRPDDPGYPPRFIHFEKLRVRGDIGWFPPVEFCSSAAQWFLIGRGSSGEVSRIGSTTRSACPLACYPE